LKGQGHDRFGRASGRWGGGGEGLRGAGGCVLLSGWRGPSTHYWLCTALHGGVAHTYADLPSLSFLCCCLPAACCLLSAPCTYTTSTLPPHYLHIPQQMGQQCVQGMQFLLAIRGCGRDNPTYSPREQIAYQQACAPPPGTVNPGAAGGVGVGGLNATSALAGVSAPAAGTPPPRSSGGVAGVAAASVVAAAAAAAALLL
jgi:hypothetical protein